MKSNYCNYGLIIIRGHQMHKSLHIPPLMGMYILYIFYYLYILFFFPQDNIFFSIFVYPCVSNVTFICDWREVFFIGNTRYLFCNTCDCICFSIVYVYFLRTVYIPQYPIFTYFKNVCAKHSSGVWP